ncbi:TlpA disulfide reductase family protein [Kangiella sp. HZ709]|uniref:TlpA family protein disulfide reductase n=1 Tax=Kangiella sp. HZ709 TaxID=2666328 RepID=UPI0012AF9CFD|nr:TlpA disulfide reductase family protein [Kangiella sp. HZ709]MRX27077.1 redoxin domain-containing protein [Kangiella sp. HZ709]
MIIYSKVKNKLFILLTIILLAACQPVNQFQLLSGEGKSLDDYKGQWLLVNFYAEWCPPCIKEIPELNALNKSGVQVLAVSYDKLSNQQLAAQKAKYNMQYPMLASEPMPYLPMERPTGLPANYLFTPQGQMIGPLLGTQTKESLLEIIRKVENSVVNTQN